jgi:S1-C subfamily serine protease
MNDGKRYDVAGIYDYSKEKDLALIKVKGERFPYLAIADSSAVATGEDAWAIGSPLGFKNTISRGIISCASRTIDDMTFIQTTAAISSGSSGGALLDGAGRVIGVTHPGNKASQHVLRKAGLRDEGWGRYYDRRLRLFACERGANG